MEIREYEVGDAEAHAKVHRQSVRKITSEDYSEEVTEAWSSKDPEDSKLEESNERFVAEEGGIIVGFSDNDKETKELSGLYAIPEYSGKGVGSQILQRVEKKAKEDGL